MIVPANPTVTRRAEAGRHRIQAGTPLPGFGRVGATPDRFKVDAILERNGREVPETIRRDR